MAEELTPVQEVELERRIFVLRGDKVMLDADLAALYGTSTMAFNQAVKRNRERFPTDFRFELTDEEYAIVRAGDHRHSRRNVRHRPAAFTEHGVAMLSSVLRSQRAIQVNIAIMRAFNRLRSAASVHVELARRLDELEQHVQGMENRYDGQLGRVFDALRELMRTHDPSFGREKPLPPPPRHS